MHWVFAAAFSSCGEQGYSSLPCASFSFAEASLAAGHGVSGMLTAVVAAGGQQRTGSVIVVLGLSCSTARGIFPDQGSNPSPLHWPLDSYPLDHQGSPPPFFLKGIHTCTVSHLVLVRVTGREAKLTKSLQEAAKLIYMRNGVNHSQRKIIYPKVKRKMGDLNAPWDLTQAIYLFELPMRWRDQMPWS